MDRNIGDTTPDDNNSHRPSLFFKSNRVLYIHDHGSKGHMFWNFEQKHEFEWEVEYKPGEWYPVENGMLPANDPQILEIFGKQEPLLGYDLVWKDMPGFMHVGWRGPMLKWETLSNFPKVYADD